MTRLLEPQRLRDHADKLHAVARRMCGNQHDAEDLVQETYSQLLARPRRVDEGAELGYLLTALRNTYVTGFRARRRRPVEVELPDDMRLPADDPARRPEAVVEARAVFAVVNDMPPALGAAIMAVDVVGLSTEQAARATGQTAKDLDRNLVRARIAVARRLAPDAVLR